MISLALLRTLAITCLLGLTAAQSAAPLADDHRLRATAALLKAAGDESSCAKAGSACVGGTFCNHPTGGGGVCVMCPAEVKHCEDFGEAVGACKSACDEREAYSASTVDVGTALETDSEKWVWCPRGGCCIHWGVRYACGCGTFQIPRAWDASNCSEKCGWYYKNCK